MPLVSVIIPTRNRCALLQRALKSVISQSFDNFEIIIINDNSTDDTASAVESFSDPRIAIISLKTCGGGAVARNKGIQSARGTYIAFLDDDDTWEPLKLERQIAQLQGRTDCFSYTGKWVFTRANATPSYSGKKPRFRHDQVRSIMSDNFVGVTSSILVPREALITCGLFDETLPALQDYDLYIRLIPLCRALCIPQPLTNYYLAQNRTQVSTDYALFKKARTLLLQKYQNHRYAAPLQKSLFFIHLKKMVKSINYTGQTIAALMGK